MVISEFGGSFIFILRRICELASGSWHQVSIDGLDGRDVVAGGRGREFRRAAGVSIILAGLEERGLGRAVGRRAGGERRRR